ncbi:single-strand DNA endonuclease 1 isoform X3 [Citrus sinensis]|nr:single-strand DNA endonuclease 1 isoform X3 [Citrus sinensis]
MSSLRRNMGSEFSCMIKEAKALGLSLGVPCLEGVEEAEAQCALLNLESLCDGCFSSDSDIFLFGARTVYRDIWLGERGYVVCYEMDDIERKLGFGRNSLITLALLLGSDYSQGVRGLGPESACQIVKSVGDNVVLQRIASEGLSFVKRAKNSKKEGWSFKCNNKEESLNQEINVNGTDHSLQRETPFSQVIDAYSNPKCYSADSEAVHRVLAQHLFQHARLHQVCVQFFQWPPEKTDEYILPKIAERDLRRFANLRANTLALGVDLPLQKVPVKCPITGIIKSRKLQGKECFEVSWEESYGLKSSVVPADLIESACPEKIVEFEERRALRQPKKSKPKSSAAEIDQKLQALMLDIESENSTSSNASFSSRVVMSEDWTAATEIDLTRRQDLLLDAESKSNANMSCYPTGSTAAKAEIIDLVSPSPVQCRNVSRIREMSDQPINTIELSDSETEKSPELERKARALRMFIASIRDDIS